MPVLTETDSPPPGIVAEAEASSGGPRETARDSDAACIDVGLVNNMPDAALETTERQFIELLDAAAGDSLVRLRLFSLPDVPRSERSRSHLNASYSDIGELWESGLDGLIVTGTEPRAPSLKDEPYWRTLTNLFDWAEANTVSTIWSCLAAHAAVLHFDGVERRLLAEKCSGVFDCANVLDHPMVKGVPSRLQMPHSRLNDLPEDALVANGYGVLTRSAEAGVDMFVKQRKSLFVFFQGHPEYEARSLLGEYRRDIGRFLRRERNTYPAMPHGYFDANTAGVLSTFRVNALSQRRDDLLASFPTSFVEGRVKSTWRSSATCMYRNWLSMLAAKKRQRSTVSGSLRLRRTAVDRPAHVPPVDAVPERPT